MPFTSDGAPGPRRNAFIVEVMDILTDQPDATEVIVERYKPLRVAAENHWMGNMINSMTY